MKKFSFYLVLLGLVLLSNFQIVSAQLTGTKNIPGDYPTLALAITDLNTQGVGAGGVILNVLPGNPQLAPAGGYVITASGTAVNTIGITGNGNVITASNTHTVGSLTDAVFKIVGGDFIGINTFVMQENPANVVTAAATNTMTEWGVALLYATTTNGSQFNAIAGNTISLNRTYSNTWGVYSNTRHSATTPATTADITAITGSNSNNAVYANLITNVNYGVAFIGSTVAAFQDVGNDIGGNSGTSGNTITNWGGLAAASTYISNSVTSYCIFMNHQTGENVAFNTLTSAAISGTAVTFRGIVKDYTATAPVGTFTSKILNNTITMTSGFTSGNFQHIASAGLGTLATATININNNTFLNSSVTGAASSSTMVGIVNSSAPGTLNMNGNIFQGCASTATTGGFTGISNTGNVTGTININNNQIGNASGNAISFSAANSATVAPIVCSGAGAASNLTIQGNDIRGIVHSVAASAIHTYINVSAVPLTATINSNTFTNLNVNTTGTTTFILISYTALATGSKTVNNNSIVTAYNRTGTSGSVTLVLDNGSTPTGAVSNCQNNNFSNITLAGSTTITGISYTDGGTAPTRTVSGNTSNNWTVGTGAIVALNFTYWNGVSSLTNNTITNLTGQSSITGINIGNTVATATSVNIANNTVNNLISTGAGGAVTGIACSNTSPGIVINANTINTLSSTGATAVIGLVVSGANAAGTNVTKNKIYDLLVTNAASNVNGITVSGGTLVNLSNNYVGDLRATTASGGSQVNGINATSATTLNAYYNTVYLNATSSGATFGSSGISVATAIAVDLRNNLVVNLSTPNGAGLTVAYRRNSTTLTSYAATSNNNSFYAGTPSAGNLIFFDGTNSIQTLAAYKAFVTPRDAFSLSENPTFASTAGGSPVFLHIPAATASTLESGGTVIGTITTDFDNDARPGPVGSVNGGGLFPDIGADEFDGVPIDATPPLITYTPLILTCSTGDRLLTANIMDVSGVPTTGVLQPRIYYRKNAGAYFSSQGTLASGTATNGTWNFNIIASDMGGLVAGDVVSYFVIAQDVATPTPFIRSNPSIGLVAADVNTVTTPPTTPNSYTINVNLSGTIPVGLTGTYTTLTAAAAAYNTGCVSGPVVFSLIDATYPSETFPINFNANVTTSAVNTLTIQPAPGNTASITGSSATGMIMLNGADFITINGSNTSTVNSVCPLVSASRNLTITNTNTATTSGIIWLGTTAGLDAVTNCTVQNCILIGNAPTTTIVGLGAGGAVIGNAGTNNNNISFNNNDIRACQFAIYSAGASATNKNQNLTVNQNVINAVAPNNIGQGGIYVAFTNNVTVAGNNVSNVISTLTAQDPVGINIGFGAVNGFSTTTTGLADGNSNISVTNNTIGVVTNNQTYSAIGIGLGNTISGTTLIANNMIYGVASNGTSGDFCGGIVLGGGTAPVNVQHNTVSMQGTLPGATAAAQASLCLAVTAATTPTALNIRNNIFTNTQLGNLGATVRFFAMGYTHGGPFTGITSNFNDLVSAGAGPGTYFIGTTAGLAAGTTATTLANWQTATSGDANSVNTAPVFAGVTDLHLPLASNGALDNLGTNIPAITNDIDCEARSATPDMGADEMPAPEINVLGNAISIVDGDLTPSLTDHTDFGNQSVCTGTVVRTYTIQNLGTAILNIPSITLAGTHAADYTVGGITLPAAIAPAGNTTFTVTFNPSANGLRTATINIANNDANENPYDYSIQGTGIDPEINVQGNSTSIPDGNTAISLTDHTDFGTACLNASTLQRTYTIQNTGNSILNISSINTSGVDAALFVVSGAPASIPAASSATFTVTFTPSSSGVKNATVNINNNDCDEALYNYEVQANVNALPVVSFTVSPNDTVCTGTSVTLSGTGADTYSWTGGITDGNSFVPASSGNYTVTGTNTTTGCTNTAVATITVNPLPTVGFTTIPNDTVCAGSSVTLSGTGANTYTWTGGITDGVSFIPASSGSYTVTGTNAATGCTNTAIASITVNPLPPVNFTALPSSTVCAGSSVTLSGAGANTYSWTGGITDGVSFTPIASGSYTVTGTNTATGCTNTAVASITVNPLPAVNFTALPSSAVCVGSSVTLTGTGANTYTWTGGITDGVSFIPAASGSYTVTGTNTATGCTNTAVASITVNPLPVVNFTALPSSTVCTGSSVTLSGTGADTYNWTGGITDGISFIPAASGSYTVTGTITATGCTNTAVASITVNPLPTVGFTTTPNDTVCAGSSVTLSGTGANTYSWTGGITNGTSFIPVASGTYTVTGTITATGCTNTAITSITVNPLPVVNLGPDQSVCSGTVTFDAGNAGSTYSWSTGATTQTVVLNTTTTVIVTVTNTNGCINRDTAIATINSSPVVALGADVVQCGGSVLLDAGNPGSTYLWSTGATSQTISPSVSGTYSVLATLPGGCSAGDTINITINPLPSVNFTALPSNTVCAGSSVTLSGTGANTYTWTGGITNGTSFVPAASGNYTVTGTITATGCTSTAVASITVNPLPAVNFTALPSSAVCTGSSVTLSGTGANTYTWTGGITNGTSFVPAASGNYTVTGTVTATGCTNTAVASITVNPLPTVNFTALPSSTVCAGSSVTLSGTGANTYTWTGGITNGTSFVPAASGNYTVTGTVTATGCTNTAVASITVNPLPSVNFTALPSNTVCAGSSVTLSGTGANTYTWTGGITNGTSFVPAASGNYTVTGTVTATGCTNTAVASITVNPLPTVNFTALPSSAVCAGSSVTLSGTGANTYTWTGGITDGTSFVPAASGNYTVTGTVTATGCTNTAVASITVNPLPTVNFTALPNSTVCAGSSVILSGTGANTYTWTGGITNGTSFVPAASGNYTVTGTVTATGCTNTAVASITVNPLPTVNFTALPSSTVCSGSSVTLSGTGANTYTWTGGITNGTSFVPAASGNYTVTGTVTATGCTNTAVAAITVNPLPTVNFTALPSSAVCAGSSVTLSGTGANTYTWTGGITNGTSFVPAASGNYTVTGTVTATGCTNTAVAAITVNPLPTVNFTALPSSTVCAGSSVTLSGTGANTYTWTGGITNGTSFVPAASGNYTVTGTVTATGCTNTAVASITVNPLPTVNFTALPSSTVCAGSSVTLSGTGANTYTWTGGITNGTSFVPAASGNYTVTGTVTATGCTNTAVASITVNPLPTVNFTALPSSTVCAGSSVTLSGTGANTYTWTGGITNGTSFVPPASGNYTVTGTVTATGCTNTAVASITVNPLPTVNFTALPSTTVCAGSSVTLSGTGANTYAWTGGITNGTSFVPVASGNYTVTGTVTATGCTNTAVAAITVNPLPTVNFTALPSSTVCAGSSVTLSGTGANTYTWTGGITNGTSFVPAASGNYTVTGTVTATGCTNTAVASITVNPLPSVNFTALPSSTVCAGSSVTLSGTGANTYTWTGGISNGTSFVPAATGNYTVTGTITATGCTNTAVAAITVNPLPVVSFSTSPNDTVCAGSSLILFGSGANTYTWTGGITNGTSFVPAASGTYTVTGTLTATGCSNTAVASITVNPLPTVGFTAIPNDTVCAGSSITLSGTGANSYTWTGGITDAVSFVPASSGTYTVTGTNTSNGCTNTTSADIVVNPLPTVSYTVAPNDTVCPGDSITLSGTGAVSYAWTGGITDAVSFAPAASLTYTVTGTDGNGCSNTATAPIVVGTVPVVNLGSDVIQPNPPAVLDAGVGFSSYLWNTTANTQTISVNTNGQYIVTVTNVFGCANSDTINVNFTSGVVNVNGTATLFGLYPNPTTNGVFNVSIQNIETSNLVMEVLDMNGRVVHNRSIGSVNGNIIEPFSLTDLRMGTYIMRITANGTSTQLRFIVNQ